MLRDTFIEAVKHKPTYLRWGEDLQRQAQLAAGGLVPDEAGVVVVPGQRTPQRLPVPFHCAGQRRRGSGRPKP